MTPSIGMCAQIACVWEATARKPGNVHRFRDFDDATYADFLLSAAAIAPVLELADRRRVGETVLEAVRATRRVVSANTNLGMVLLLAPLAAVPPGENLRSGLDRVLESLDVADSLAVYDAIRLAAPGGLGHVSEQDVAAEPTLPLRDIMALAADRDLIARQYSHGFLELFDDGVPVLRQALADESSLEDAIVFGHLNLLARHVDSLIQRKRGLAEAREATQRAGQALAAWPSPARLQALGELDAWLRSAGHARNPGTTADLVTASLFILLREGTIRLPLSLPWSVEPCHG